MITKVLEKRNQKVSLRHGISYVVILCHRVSYMSFVLVYMNDIVKIITII